ncbi:MAG TPA: long-chain fatty acid--CoA ligase [Gaiellaceae bacterium]|nr:long-chain fatty acid--CoA ligase [Gaiellaceae bacterium]
MAQPVEVPARGAVSAPTVGALWQRAIDARRPGPAFLEERDGDWHEVSWDEAASRVSALANGFLSLGVEKGDRVAILARTRLEWTLTDYALATIGAAVVPIYPTSSPAEVTFVLGDSATKVLVAENAEQIEKLEGHDLPALERVVGIDVAGADGTLADLEKAGWEHAAEHPDALARAAADVGPDDVLTFLYTSGTTGNPKGCILSQRNYVAMVDSVVAVDDLFRPEDSALLFLPLAHNFARLIQFTNASVGYTLAFCADVRNVTTGLGKIRPTLFPSVPRVYEKVYTTVQGQIAESSGLKRRIGEWGLKVGMSGRNGLQRKLADRLVLGKVRARLGGRLRHAVSGGAPLSKEVAEFFDACGVTILEGYGMTECTTAATLNRPGKFRYGTVGQALPGIELSLDTDGEILIRGATIFGGYYENAEATAEVLTEEGWLRSGDIGTIDDDGYLTITDRKKDIIVTAGGKNVAPQVIENALKTSPYISQALVVGDNRPYIVALITLDPDAIGGLDDPRAAIQATVDAVNADLGRVEQVKRFAILPRDFSIEEGEMTPTLKLKRRICIQHFESDLEALYAAARE